MAPVKTGDRSDLIYSPARNVWFRFRFRFRFNLLQIIAGVIPRNLKNDVFISNRFPKVHKRGIHTDRQTYTHTTIA